MFVRHSFEDDVPESSKSGSNPDVSISAREDQNHFIQVWNLRALLPPLPRASARPDRGRCLAKVDWRDPSLYGHQPLPWLPPMPAPSTFWGLLTGPSASAGVARNPLSEGSTKLGDTFASQRGCSQHEVSPTSERVSA